MAAPTDRHARHREHRRPPLPDRPQPIHRAQNGREHDPRQKATGHAGPHGRSPPAADAKTVSIKDAHGHKLAVTSTTAITGRISIDTDPDHRELRVNGNLMAPTLESDYFPLLPGLNMPHPHRSHRRQSRVQALTLI